ncbi:MAG TPA: CHAT domain-containing protein [Anaerolineae bacterium]|nr:CHAT domain-containing protein [Anaerolineae bacterium]
MTLLNDVPFKLYWKRSLSENNDIDKLPLLNFEQIQQFANLVEPYTALTPARVWRAFDLIQKRVSLEPSASSFLVGITHWYVAWAANHWGRVDWAQIAVQRAEENLGDDNDWQWACLWQYNAMPWTRPNFSQAVIDLETALSGLAMTPLADWGAHVALSLSFAYLLVGELDKAAEIIGTAQKQFEASQDQLNLVRCYYILCSILRRQSEFSQAENQLNQIETIATKYGYKVELAKAYYQWGYIYLTYYNDYPEAYRVFTKALVIFKELEMPLWIALCESSLAQVLLNDGVTTEIVTKLQSAIQIFETFNIIGSRADALLDMAKYERLAGNYLTSISLLELAKDAYTAIEATVMVTTALMHLGATYAFKGNYRLALHFLEKAEQGFIEQKQSYRLAECRLRLSQVWLDTNYYDKAEQNLHLVLAYYQAIEIDNAYVVAAYHRLADVYLRQGRANSALETLAKCRPVVEQLDHTFYNVRQIYFHGVALFHEHQFEIALDLLLKAEHIFAQVGFLLERSMCLVMLGETYLKLEQFDEAANIFELVIQLNQGFEPFYIWPAYSGLAQLASKENQIDDMIVHYQQMFSLLTQQKRRLHQPELVNNYLQPLIPHLQQAIQVGAQLDSPELLLNFIENSKAATLFSRLHQQQITNVQVPTEISENRVTIQQLRSKVIKFEKEGFFKYRSAISQTKQQIQEKYDLHKELYLQWEREQSIDSVEQLRQFDLSQFRQLAGRHLGGGWCAVNYYLTADTIYAILITPNEIYSYQQPFKARIKFALDIVTNSWHSDQTVDADDLIILGDWLFSAELLAQLASDDHLIIIPHQQLHQLPWGALRHSSWSSSLVEKTIPIVVPSINILCSLWEQKKEVEAIELAGVLLGVAEFAGKQSDLPYINDEIKAIERDVEEKGWGQVVTMPQTATKEQLGEILKERTNLVFAHIATHISYDSRNGRNGYIALLEDDLWQDEIGQYGPWPSLVTLSGCDSGQQKMYHGDEQVGLVSAFLTAGTQTVVATLLSIPDATAAYFFAIFYGYFFDGHSPATALALTQRQLLAEKKPLKDWASIFCIGCP